VLAGARKIRNCDKRSKYPLPPFVLAQGANSTRLCIGDHAIEAVQVVEIRRKCFGEDDVVIKIVIANSSSTPVRAFGSPELQAHTSLSRRGLSYEGPGGSSSSDKTARRALRRVPSRAAPTPRSRCASHRRSTTSLTQSHSIASFGSTAIPTPGAAGRRLRGPYLGGAAAAQRARQSRPAQPSRVAASSTLRSVRSGRLTCAPKLLVCSQKALTTCASGAPQAHRRSPR
jgi:hypothetical protein